MTITVSPTWQQAMERALADKQKAHLHTDGTFTVPSKSCPGAFHTVLVDEAGHITHCTCRGWERYGRSNPCRHAGAVALARAYMMGAHLVPMAEVA